jgi:hypothetical protein
MEFKRSWVTRRGPNLVHTGFRPKGKGYLDKYKCYDYVIKNMDKVTPDSIQLAPVRHRQYPWLFGPATMLSSRSIVYPCSRGKCELPCPCLICHKKHPKCRAGQSCGCQDCQLQFEDHSNYHACRHMGCKYCHNIVTVMSCQCSTFSFLTRPRRSVIKEWHLKSNSAQPISSLLSIGIWSSNF